MYDESDEQSARDVFEQMSREHLEQMSVCRKEFRLSKSRVSPARERHFVARLEWYTCVNRALELAIPHCVFNLGERLEHYDHDRLGI